MRISIFVASKGGALVRTFHCEDKIRIAVNGFIGPYACPLNPLEAAHQ